MPVTNHDEAERPLYQREQYAKSALARFYWNYRDNVALSFIEQGSRRKIVDIGCGEGITLEKMTKRFSDCDVLGIDGLAENIGICTKHGLNAIMGDAYRLDLSNDSVDAVTFMEVIEHLENPEKAIAEIYRVLKPGGRLVLMFPNDSFFLIARLAVFKFKEAAYDPGHLKQWTPGEAKEFLTVNGFKVRMARSLPFYFWSISLHGVIGAVKPA